MNRSKDLGDINQLGTQQLVLIIVSIKIYRTAN